MILAIILVNYIVLCLSDEMDESHELEHHEDKSDELEDEESDAEHHDHDIPYNEFMLIDVRDNIKYHSSKYHIGSCVEIDYSTFELEPETEHETTHHSHDEEEHTERRLKKKKEKENEHIIVTCETEDSVMIQFYSLEDKDCENQKSEEKVQLKALFHNDLEIVFNCEGGFMELENLSLWTLVAVVILAAFVAGRVTLFALCKRKPIYNTSGHQVGKDQLSVWITPEFGKRNDITLQDQGFVVG